MHRMARLLVMVAAVAMLTGCMMVPKWGGRKYVAASASGSRSFPVTPVVVPPGFIWSETAAPLSCDFQQTPVDGGRTGVSSVRFLSVPFTYGFLSFSWGDASLEEAVRAGGLEQVDFADYEVMQVLTVFTEMKVTAHGR